MKLRAQLDVVVWIEAKDRDEALKKFHAGLSVYTDGEIHVEKTTLRAFRRDSEGERMILAAVVIGFLLGAGSMFRRIAKNDRLPLEAVLRGEKPTPRTPRQRAIVAICMVVMGVWTAFLFAIVAAPIVAFVQRVDSIERRLPPARPR